MSDLSLAGLLGCLKLAETEPGACFIGGNLDLELPRVFGGQILAQLVSVAAAASPDKTVKSMTVLFPSEGDTDVPISYRVSKHRDGRTFATLTVVAEQAPSGGKVIAAATMSLHACEEGLAYQVPAPIDAGPEAATRRDLGLVPWETRIAGDVDLLAGEAGPAEFRIWMRAPDLQDEELTSKALLAHATDLTLIGTALRPFDGISQADSGRKFASAVTSHTVWFHQPFTLTEWLLLDQHSPVIADGRAFGRGDVFTGSGRFVASYAQEAMIRTHGFDG